MHFEVTIVVDEAQFSNLVHEVADTRPSNSDHLGEYFLGFLL
jgi:hypothetical protein